MGLGLHGGGSASALFLASRGAHVTVTDLKNREQLRDSMDDLEGLPIRYVLGRHDGADFANTDMVVKNPGVPRESPLLALARDKGIPIESDISLFLRSVENPLIAVTGSKGKSTVASAIHCGLKEAYRNPRLGGNITLSPLTFINELQPGDPVVLELSSWQLADLKEKALLKPKIAVVTNIMPDHMNRYSSMEEYVDDKRVIVAEQDERDYAVLEKGVVDLFSPVTSASIMIVTAEPESVQGAFLDGEEGWAVRGTTKELLVPRNVRLVGRHNRLNLVMAALALRLFDLPLLDIQRGMSQFQGLEHRMELVHESTAIAVYNDSAATIPQATVKAMESLEPPLRVLMGGTDKNIDFSPLTPAIGKPERSSCWRVREARK